MKPLSLLILMHYALRHEQFRISWEYLLSLDPVSKRCALHTSNVPWLHRIQQLSWKTRAQLGGERQSWAPRAHPHRSTILPPLSGSLSVHHSPQRVAFWCPQVSVSSSKSIQRSYPTAQWARSYSEHIAEIPPFHSSEASLVPQSVCFSGLYGWK